MEVLVGAFNQEKALVGAFSVIVKLQTRSFVSSSNSVVGYCAGLSNAAKARSRPRALFWLVIFTGFGALTLQALISVIQDYFEYPYVTVTDITYRAEVRFMKLREYI